MRIYLTSLGCKLNQAENEALARLIDAREHRVVTDPQMADWAIVNTCTVTHIAARKSRQLIRALHKTNPALRIAVTGCYAEMSAEEVHALAGVHLVMSNAAKERVLEGILALTPPEPAVEAILQPTRGHRLALGHTRAFVKIQDGCDNLCTYCIVATARGPQRSRPSDQVLEEVRARVAEGYQEIVLTGVHIGAYGHDSAPSGPLPPVAGWSLARLVQEILDQTEVPRLRLSSIEPWDLSSELLLMWDRPRLCRQIHLPLQSGCDETLQRMGRRYTSAQFARLVDRIRERIPGVSLTTDVIVGFPGETEAEFEATRAFVESMRFARLHVFKYSRRAGTPAAGMTQQVAPEAAHTRSDTLLALGRRLAQEFHARFVGTEIAVLFESRRTEQDVSIWSGLTDNYLRVSVPFPGDLANVLAQVRCLSAGDGGLSGELLA